MKVKCSTTGCLTLVQVQYDPEFGTRAEFQTAVHALCPSCTEIENAEYEIAKKEWAAEEAKEGEGKTENGKEN